MCATYDRCMEDLQAVDALRASPAADRIRSEHLIVVLRRIAPQQRLIELVAELVEAGARIFEVTWDAPSPADDLQALLTKFDDRDIVVGAGTLRSPEAVEAARRAGAAFGVAPVFDPAVLRTALQL